MRQIIFLIILIVSSCFFNAKTQTTQDFLKSCVEEERSKGAKIIIINANLCSVCMTEPIFEGCLFIKDSTNTYKIRYLKYVNRYASVKVLKDTIFIDSDIESIFIIVENYQDSIFWQLSNMESLLTVKVVKDGKTMYREPLMHGKMRYIGLYHNEKSAISIHSIINLNDIFDKAYYYWLLSSSINNYCNDFLKSQLQNVKK